MNAEYRRRGWALVPIPPGEKAPRVKDWQSRIFEPADFVAGDNSGVILGRRSGELVDIDLGCAEALALADTYLPATHAEFGRASKLRPHRLYATPNSAYESAQATRRPARNTASACPPSRVRVSRVPSCSQRRPRNSHIAFFDAARPCPASAPVTAVVILAAPRKINPGHGTASK